MDDPVKIYVVMGSRGEYSDERPPKTSCATVTGPRDNLAWRKAVVVEAGRAEREVPNRLPD